MNESAEDLDEDDATAVTVCVTSVTPLAVEFRNKSSTKALAENN